MKRRTLDFIFVGGGLLVALLLGVLGMVLKSNADFAKDYVRDQLVEQGINFKKAEALVASDAWKADLLEGFEGDQTAVDEFIKANKLTAEADSKCLQKYAGQPMETGKMAECYANDFIRLHLKDGSIYAAKLSANPEWQKPIAYTYATIGGVQGELRSQVAKAKETNDPKLPEYEAALAKVNSLRTDTLFRGETLRGVLLTAYGFSVFGEKADQAAMVAFGVALVLLLASIAGLIHALTTPKDKLVGSQDETPPSPDAAPTTA